MAVITNRLISRSEYVYNTRSRPSSESSQVELIQGNEVRPVACSLPQAKKSLADQ